MTVHRIDQTDRVTLGKVHLRLFETTANGWIFRHVDDPAIHVSVTHAEWEAARADYDFRHQPGFFGEDGASARDKSGLEEFFDLATKQRTLAAFSYGFARDYISLEKLQAKNRPELKADRVCLSDRGLAAAIRLILAARRASAIDAKREEAGARAYKPRGGKAKEGREAPCVKTLRKYVKLAEAHAHAEVARHRTDKCHGETRTSLDVEVLMARSVARYMSRLRPSVAQLWSAFRHEFKKDAARRSQAGEPALVMPSESTFRRRVGSLHAFTVDVARLGLEGAEGNHGPVTQGLDATRPGQFVLMDEFRVPLITLFVASGAWEHMTPTERKLVERVRPWICVAMDAATRVILGMCMMREPSTASTLACLRMVVSDKGRYADAVGALSPWDMACTPELVMTDMGSAFTSDATRAAILGLRSAFDTGPAARPQLRALIERLFGTIHTQLCSRFEGRTFANVVLKGDYDASKRACLTPEELGWALVRYAVDVYHNSPHEGLNGQTPADCWREKTITYPPRQLPDRHRLRSVFGQVRRSKTSTSGVEVYGLFYHAKALRQHTSDHGFGTIDVTVDDEDLGGVIAHLDGRKVPLRCMARNFDGRSLATWREAQELVRGRHAKGARIKEDIAFKALEEIEAQASRGIARIGLGDPSPSRRSIRAATERLDIAWTMPGDERPFGDEADLFSGAIEAGTPFAPGPEVGLGQDDDDASHDEGSPPARERPRRGKAYRPRMPASVATHADRPSRAAGAPGIAPSVRSSGEAAPVTPAHAPAAPAPAGSAPVGRRPGPPPRSPRSSALRISEE